METLNVCAAQDELWQSIPTKTGDSSKTEYNKISQNTFYPHGMEPTVNARSLMKVNN